MSSFFLFCFLGGFALSWGRSISFSRSFLHHLPLVLPLLPRSLFPPPPFLSFLPSLSLSFSLPARSLANPPSHTDNARLDPRFLDFQKYELLYTDGKTQRVVFAGGLTGGGGGEFQSILFHSFSEFPSSRRVGELGLRIGEVEESTYRFRSVFIPVPVPNLFLALSLFWVLLLVVLISMLTLYNREKRSTERESL